MQTAFLLNKSISLQRLIKKKEKIEHEIYLMEFIDRWRPEQKSELEQYEMELKNVNYQIAQLTNKENP